jgi:hypothetical protein
MPVSGSDLNDASSSSSSSSSDRSLFGTRHVMMMTEEGIWTAYDPFA